MSGFRYYEEQRSFDESLREIEVIENFVPEPDYGGLERIARGETALAKMANTLPPPPLEQEQKKQELKTKLKALLTEKQQRELNKQLKVACFIEHAKLADFSDPGGLIGLRQPGDGLSNDEPKQPERRHEGVHQGPAANLIAAKLKELKQEEQARKVAARMDKEIAAGNIRLQDVDPGIPAGLNNTAYGRWASRQRARAAAPMSAPQLAHMDRMDTAWKNNQHLLAERAKQRLATGGYTQPGGDAANTFAGRALHQQDFLASKVHNQPFPGQGAYTLMQDVYIPDNSARQLQTYATRGPTAMGLGAKYPKLQNLFYSPTPAGAATTNRAVTGHEFAEREAIAKGIAPNQHQLQQAETARAAAAPGQVLPVQAGELLDNASHKGLEPHVQERLHARGRPETNELLDRVRHRHSDDRLVKKKMQQMGFTANNPMPAGGRAQRTVEQYMKKNPQLLARDVQQRSLANQLQMDARDFPVSMVNLPQKARDASKALVAQGNASKQVVAAAKQQGPVGILRAATSQVRPLFSRFRAFSGALK